MPERFYQLFFNDQAAGDDFYPNVIEVEVEANADQADTFRIKVRLNLQDDGEWSEVASDKFGLFTKVRVEAGFREGTAEILTEGYLTEVNLHFEEPARQPYLEARGLDASVLMSVEEKIAAWPNQSDSDIATRILASYGFTPDVTSTQPVHQENDVTLIQRGTDLQFLRRLARKNGFEVGVEKDFATGQVTGYFRPPRLDQAPQRTLAVAFGNDTSLSWFDVRIDGLKPLAVEARQIEAKTKTPNAGAGNRLQLSPIGRQPLEALVSGPLGSVVSPQETAGKLWLQAEPASDTTELTVMAQAVRDEAAWLVTARGEINSQAYGTVLRANRLVLVKGAGALHSGKYYVTRVVHRIDAAGAYVQTFEARRNAIGLDGSENFSDRPALPV